MKKITRRAALRAATAAVAACSCGTAAAAPCARCNGFGTVKCGARGCNMGYVGYEAGGRVRFEKCATCDGSGERKCGLCGGTGKEAAAEVPAAKAPVKLSDEAISKLLTGQWSLELSQPPLTLKCIESFDKDGTYSAKINLSERGKATDSTRSGTWVVKDGVLVVTIKKSDYLSGALGELKQTVVSITDTKLELSASTVTNVLKRVDKK